MTSGAGGRPARPRGRRSPPPAEAGANLAVHDLKNLAGRLSFLSRNLADHYDDPLFKGTALDLLEDTVRQMKRLASDLRNREGRIVIKLRVDLNRLLSEALHEVRPDLARNVVVEEDCAPNPAIWGDSFLLRRAFACAIENALEAMGGRGSLFLKTRTTRQRDRARILVEIRDTGPGMSEESLKARLLRPLESVKEDGLGLGVYTMRQVARLHGGSLRIASTSASGTRLQFSFPVPSE